MPRRWLLAAVVLVTSTAWAGAMVTAEAARAVPAAPAPTQEDTPPTQDELETLTASVECPVIAGVTAGNRGVSGDNSSVNVYCPYSTDTGYVQIGVTFNPPTATDAFYCGGEDSLQDDPQYETVSAIINSQTAAVDANWSYPRADTSVRQPDVEAAARQLLAAAEKLAQQCPPVPDCSPAVGSLPLTFADTTAAFVTPAAGIWEAHCAYSPDDDDFDQLSDLGITVLFAMPGKAGGRVIEVCSAEPGTDRGVIIVEGPGDAAVMARIDFRQPDLPYDTASAVAEAQRIMAAVAPAARTCEGVERIPDSSLYTPAPPWLAEALTPGRASGSATLALVEGGGTTSLVGDTSASPGEPGVTTVPPSTGPPSTGPAPASGEADTPPPPGTEEAKDSWTQTALRIGGWVMLAVSVAGLLLTLVLMRKESRVRPRLDVARTVVMLVTAVLTMVILRRSTPAWVIAVAVVVGAGLGVVQGRHSRIRLVGKRVMAKRNTAAIIAFVVGLVLSQGAGLANRFGVLAVGVGVTFLAAALAGGLIAGRHPAVRDARHLGATVAVVILLGGPVLALLASGSSDRAVASSPRQSEEAGLAYVEGLVDWTSVDFIGGYGALLGKPPIELSVPPKLAAPPEDLTGNSTWTSDSYGYRTDYDLDEQFAFELSAEGTCCVVGYSFEGTVVRTLQDGSVTSEALAGEAHLGALAALPADEPFGRKERYDVDSCGRRLARFDEGDNRGWQTFTVNGESQSESVPSMALYTDCTIPGFSVSDALGRAPAAPPADDPVRVSAAPGAALGTACPVYQEIVASANDDTWGDEAGTGNLMRLYTDPNSTACAGDVSLGDELPDGRRAEMLYAFATTDPEYEASRQWNIADSFLLQSRPYTIPEAVRCTTDADGVPQNGPGQESCLNRSYHEVDEGRITIWTDTDTRDGPNTEIRGDFPWGSYSLRCHHCEPGDPEIASLVGTWHDLGRQQGGNAPLAAPGAEPVDSGESDSGESDSGTDAESDQETDTASDTETETATETATETETATDSDTDAATDTEGEGAADTTGTTDDDEEISAEEAALAAFIGLLGAAGVAGSTLLEGGLRTAEVAEPGRPEEPVSPDGPGADGLYQWGSRRVSAEDYAELLAEEQREQAERQARIDALVAEMNSDEAATQRFATMRQRSVDDDRRAREALAEELDDLRRKATTRDRVAEVLAERARTGGWDGIAQRLAQGDNLTRDELIGLRSALDRLERQQGTIDPRTTGTYTTDLVDEFAQDAAVAQEALATVADAGFGPAGGWIVRNPKDSGRLAAAVLTGGFSEGVIAPYEMLDAMERAAARAHAEGRDLTHAEAMAAAAYQAGPGLLLGHLSQMGLTRFGPALRSSMDDGLEAAATQVDEFLKGRGRIPGSAAAQEGLEAAVKPAASWPAPLTPQALSELKTNVAAAVGSGDDAALRQLYRNHGMKQLGQLEAAGGLDEATAQRLVGFHDRLTSPAVRQGTVDAVEEFQRAHGIRPREVLVGNSGSVGGSRSVLTDADRTVSTTFSDNDIDRWIARNGGTRSEAARQMQDEFARIKSRNVELALNDPNDVAVRIAREEGLSLPEAVERARQLGVDDPAAASVRLTASDVDTKTYSGFGGGTGQADAYPTGFTRARQALQGTTDVYRVSPSGEVTSYATSGRTIVDHNELEQIRFGTREIAAADGWPLDPTRISSRELGPLLEQQRIAVGTYTDVKSVSKAIDRAQYIASRSGQPMADPRLVEAATRIRQSPRETASILREMGMSESEYVAASREMMGAYQPQL